MLQVRLLGCIEVDVDGVPNVSVGAAKARWILVFLALGAGRSRSVESIIEAIWGEHPPASAPNLVQGYVSDLRKAIGHEAIQTSDNGYTLVVDDDAVDVVRFRELSRRGRAAATLEPRHARPLLEEALALGGGTPFGEDPPPGPLTAASAHLVEEWVDVAEVQGQTLVDLGDHWQAVNVLDELVNQHPYREGLWATLAVALYRSDRQVDALRRLAQARQILEDDLGVSPGPRLVEVEQQILNHDPALIASASSAVNPSNSPMMVGRSQELVRLRDRLHQTARGARHTIFIGGEPGIGKTTITRELTRTAADGRTVVLVGRCDEHVAVPYRPFIEALTDHVRTLGDEKTRGLFRDRWDAVVEVVPALNARRTFAEGPKNTRPSNSDMTLLERFDTFCWMLEQVGGSRRFILVLEDLHWADSATLRLLHYLTRGDRLPGTLVIGTHRSTESAELLDDVLADLRTEPQVERMLLSGLAVADLMQLMTRDLSGADDETARWIYRETDGNPFLAIEIIDHIVQTGSRDGVPIGVAEVVSRRLRRLSSESQTLLNYAAILGETAPVSLLRQFAGAVADVPGALAEATQAGILVEEDVDERCYRFTHAIIRKAATATLSSLQLEDLHLAAARAWALQPPSEGITVAVASHYLAASTAAEVDEAVAAFNEAGVESDRTGAMVEAVEWYDRALTLLSKDDPRFASLRLKKFVAAQAAWHWLHGDYGKSDPV